MALNTFGPFIFYMNEKNTAFILLWLLHIQSYYFGDWNHKIHWHRGLFMLSPIRGEKETPASHLGQHLKEKRYGVPFLFLTQFIKDTDRKWWLLYRLFLLLNIVVLRFDPGRLRDYWPSGIYWSNRSKGKSSRLYYFSLSLTSITRVDSDSICRRWGTWT